MTDNIDYSSQVFMASLNLNPGCVNLHAASDSTVYGLFHINDNFGSLQYHVLELNSGFFTLFSTPNASYY